MTDMPAFPARTPARPRAAAAEAPEPVLATGVAPDPVPSPPAPPLAAAAPKKTKPKSLKQTKRQLVEREKEIRRERMGTENGKPPSYDPMVGEGICLDIASGMSLTKACEERGLTVGSVWLWRQKYPVFGQAYHEALEQRMDRYVHEIEEIADGTAPGSGVDVKRDQLRTTSRQWIASKVAPKKYGERLQIDQGDPLERYRKMTDQQRLNEARILVEEAQRVLAQAAQDGITIEGTFTTVEDKA